MAYQSVGQCRFFVDSLTWLRSLGLAQPTEGSLDVFNLNPSSQTTITTIDGTIHGWTIGIQNEIEVNYYMLLGHNFGGYAGGDIATSDGLIGFNLNAYDSNLNVNAGGTNAIDIGYSGFSIGGIDKMTISAGDIAYRYYTNMEATLSLSSLSCFCLGKYYDLPHSPDLSLTLTRDYSGIKTIETKGGASLSNSFYTSPPKWGGTREAWQLGDTDFSTGGRRSWSLSFSYLSDSSVFPDNPTEIAGGGGWEVDDATPDFMSEVLKKTRGSMLRFIFQPNTDENLFAICKFDMKSFKFKQVSNGIFNISLKIREVW